MSEAQTAYIRGDTEGAKKQFQLVLQIDPRNQVASNYLRMIQAQDAKKPVGNNQEIQLAKLIIPKLEFRDATLGSAIEYLRQAVTKASDGKQSVNFVLNIPDEQAKTQTITLALSNIPFTEVVKYIGELAGLRFDYEKYAIKVSSKGGATASATGTAPAPAAPATPAIPGLAQ